MVRSRAASGRQIDHSSASGATRRAVAGRIDVDGDGFVDC